MHLTLEVKAYHQFYWLRAIRDVRIDKCCAGCFNAVRDDRVFNATRYSSDAVVDIDVVEDSRAIAYYLCGLSAGFNWHKNSHVAFIPSKGERIEIDDDQMRLTITDARRIEFETYEPHPIGKFTPQQRRCRNWIFANYVKDGLLKEAIKSMETEKIIELNERNIRQALKDYGKYTNSQGVLNDISDKFIKRLAEDNAYSKEELRELFRKSPVWDEELQALVINGTRTHNPDTSVIKDLAYNILSIAFTDGKISYTNSRTIMDYFASAALGGEAWPEAINLMNSIAPKAYAPGKKLSRIFKALCVALGIADDTAGSAFQRMYAKFADELTSRRIGFKLFVSINPAHFLTMSNPKNDNRGSTLTSCHSLNSTAFPYNNGCSGYARDSYTFIVFTVDDPSNPELLNNRKTTRQIFAYKPNNGVLLQSRLYNTSGGTHGAQEDSKTYRDLVQREISMLEDVPNLWKTYNSYNSDKSHLVRIGTGFGGYADWTYSDFDGKISVRTDHEEDCQPIYVGTFGLCICCGTEIDEKLYCGDCGDEEMCDECEEYFNHDDLVEVNDGRGNTLMVCHNCRDDCYTYCERCGEYYPNDNTTYLESISGSVCDDCLNEYYAFCDNCNSYVDRDCAYDAYDAYGRSITICSVCRDDNFGTCEECGDLYHLNAISSAYDEHNEIVFVCRECVETECSECVDCAGLYLNRALNSAGRCRDCAESADEETENTDTEEAAI